MNMLRAAGIFFAALGCIWLLQGLGWLAWPAGSFMLGRSEWALGGAIAIALGLGLILTAFVRFRR